MAILQEAAASVRPMRVIADVPGAAAPGLDEQARSGKALPQPSGGRSEGAAGSRMQFDWYQATVVEPCDRLLAWAETAYSDCERSDAKGRNSYVHRRDFSQGGIAMLSISFGGPNRWANATATSGAAPRFASALRKHFARPGQIRVTRVDSCQDFESADCFGLMHATLHKIAHERGIVTEHAGDWDRAERGRSYYLGSRDSAFRVVEYEKGIQMHDQIIASGGSARPDLVRLEARARPQDVAAKVFVSRLQPDEVWGCSPWGRAVYKAVIGLDVQPVKMSDYRMPAMTLSRFAMIRQYYRTMGDWIAEVDHDETVLGAAIMDIFDSVKRDKAQAGAAVRAQRLDRRAPPEH